jgi:small GTP-binding protein
MPKRKSEFSKSTNKTLTNDLNIALQNLLENKATSGEMEELRQAFTNGEIFIGGNVQNSVIIVGSGNSVQLSPEVLERLFSANNLSVRHQLPQPPSDFIGRENELETILTSFEHNGRVIIGGMSGMGGVGKTALGLVVAHKLTEKYSDGQFFIDLRGGSKDPLKPYEAMKHVVQSLYPTADLKNITEPEMIEAYHSALSDKQVLLFLDNASGASQVIPLLPLPQHNCGVIITSRFQFVIPESKPLQLDVLQEQDAIQFLIEICPRLNEKEASQIASLCGRLPLALRLAGGVLQADINMSAEELIERLSPEILKNKKDVTSVITYLSRLSIFDEGHGRRANEAKVLFVGQGSVGKTSLIQQLVYGVFHVQEIKTEGISIIHWHVDADLALNVWDFGGQEIMHATHQFFLTKRSLYLLILDSRLTQEENRVEYWLKIIQSFSDESPVLIVGNKTDQHPLDIDRTGLQKKYPNIVGIFETSASIGAGIEELKTAIIEQVNTLPHVRDLLPETWFTVKTKLEELGKQSNFITQEKYLDLCAENEVSDETSQRTLIGFLHDLGVVLHFQDDPRLEALGILNPQWVTNGVYKILNSHTLFQNKGVLTTSMLDEILNLPEYPRGKRLFIVDMMKKFELCYDIEPDKTFLVPDLLPKDEPAELKFNGVPAFEYAYPVLPSSVITRFIVRMNQKIDDGFVWRTGVVLKIGDNTALVKADIEDRKITIAIDGQEHTRRDALSAIRYELGEIHNSIKGLNPQQRVPVPNAPHAEPLKYEYLLKLERAGQETLLVENGNDLVTVNMRQMLSAIESEAQRKEQGAVINNFYSARDGGVIVGRDFSGNLISGDDNQIIQDSYNKIKSADIQPELKETLKQLVEAVETMSKSLPEEQSAEVTEDLGKLVDEAIKSKPNKKWYSVSIEGLIKAAENVEKVGEPVINLSRKVLSLLTGGVVK